MTYEDIYNEALNKIQIINESMIADYRPADPFFIDELSRPIPNAILLYLKNGSKVIYISNEKSMDIGSV